MRRLHEVALLVAVGLAACGVTTTTGTSRQFDDAGISRASSDGAADANLPSGDGGGTFACGSNRCSADEICVYPACGCIVETAPRTDAGVCPPGFTPQADTGMCIVPIKCPASPPRCMSPVGLYYECSGEDGTFLGLVSGPLPTGASHVCYASCV
jgi:hypothetical protein